MVIGTRVTGTREQILEATRAICREDGFGAVTMRRVAARVGVTAPALYRHFADKGELIRELIVAARDTFRRYLAGALEHSTPIARFEASAAAYLDFGLEQPQAYEMLFMTPNQLGMFGVPNALETWRDSPPDTFQFVVDRVAECMRSGDFKPGDPHEIALGLSATAHGLLALWLAGRFGGDEQQFRGLYRTSIGAHLTGIATASSS